MFVEKETETHLKRCVKHETPIQIYLKSNKRPFFTRLESFPKSVENELGVRNRNGTL